MHTNDSMHSYVRRLRLLIVLVAAVVLSAGMASYMAFGAAGSARAQEESGSSGDSSAITDELRQRLQNTDANEPTEAVVTFEEKPSQAQVAALRELGVQVKTFRVLPMVGVSGTASQIQQVAGLEVGDNPVVSVSPNERLDYQMDESRPAIGADTVRDDLGYTGEGVGVAVIDSGIDGRHPDLSYPDKTVQNTKILTNSPLTGQSISQEDFPNTDTSSGHGTHVAGTIGADGSASNGRYRGVAPRADMVGIGTGDAQFILYALEGFDYALANQDRYDIRAINNSYGTTGPFDPEDPINVASKIAHDSGMTVVFSAGNSGPANDTINPYSVAPWVIGVAAGEKDGETLAEFSSRGTPGSERQRPTLTGPGVDVVSSRGANGAFANGGADDFENVPSQYRLRHTTLSGTSMSAPHVTGVVALMEEANPALGPDQMKRILEQSASPMPGYAPHEVGAGYLDAEAAVQAAESAGGSAQQGAA